MIHFPVTIKRGSESNFFGNLTFYASKTDPYEQRVQWVKVSSGSPVAGATVTMDSRLLHDASTALSVMSSFQGFCDYTDYTGPLWVWYTPGTAQLFGASEGIAALLAMLGYKNDRKSVTGVVKVFGSDAKHDLMQYRVDSVDSVPIKIDGCNRRGIELGYPKADDTGVKGGTPISTVEEAIKFITT